MSDPLLGRTLGDYRVEELIGRGGMGAVYRAEHLGHRRVVALKVLPDSGAQDAAARQRFQREIKIALQLEHPNIVPVYDAGYEEGIFYIAMRLVEGPDLSSLCEGNALAPERAAKFLCDVGRALHFVHRAGHIHRDVKPPNVLVADASTPDEYALLADFGIARARESETQLTQGVIGTPAYLAPELVRWLPPSPATDQYALACLAFELFAGRPPFIEDLPVAHVEQEPPRVENFAPRLAGAVADAVERGLAKDPGDRFETVTDFIDALAGLRSGYPVRPDTAKEATLRNELVAIITASDERWVDINDLLEKVIRRGRCFPPNSTPPTTKSLAAQVRRYPRVFRRDGSRIALVPGAEKRLY